MKYAIKISKNAEKELKALHPNIALRIGRHLLALGGNPHPAQSKKLKDTAFYRLRVGDYRIIYTIYDKTREVNILAIGHRREVYRQWGR
jgi:mRNA interferase RelE/StbE